MTGRHDDVDTLADALASAVARGDTLDAFLAAAGLMQVAEDAREREPGLLLHAAGRLSGGGPARRTAAAAARGAAHAAGDVAARRRPPQVGAWSAAVGRAVDV